MARQTPITRPPSSRWGQRLIIVIAFAVAAISVPVFANGSGPGTADPGPAPSASFATSPRPQSPDDWDRAPWDSPDGYDSHTLHPCWDLRDDFKNYRRCRKYADKFEICHPHCPTWLDGIEYFGKEAAFWDYLGWENKSLWELLFKRRNPRPQVR
ncbi:hypothetical protein Ait01nite_100750 [Actinoplanes italicus]|nr:hypothetical protein Ait01nite_100750 [Actinoplanes italicus]